MHPRTAFLYAAIFLVALATKVHGQPSEEDYYPLTTFEIPEDVVLETGAFELLPSGKLAAASRRGEIWLIDQPFAEKVKADQFHRYAHGLHEVLGLAEKDGWLYATQRCELTRIKDLDNDGEGDLFQTVNDDWGISGDYHEYAFGSDFDSEGNLWITLCLTGSSHSAVPYRGWCVRINENGEMIPTCSGIRSPGGMGADLNGNMFYTDNQGPWNGTCSLKHLVPGKFMGHPGGNKWYNLAEETMGPAPEEPESGSRFVVEAEKIPEYEPPSILFPYKKMGQSASGIACDFSRGKFGPFSGQMFVGDQTHSTVMRCYLEKVEGHYQGACFPFREGLASGTLALEMTEQGSLFASGTSRGWGSRGTAPYAIERLDWTGKVPFEILEMHARPEGFELVFTQPVEKSSATNVDSYELETYTYIYQASYGSPEVDHTQPEITEIEVSEDGKRILLKIDQLQRGHVHELHCNGLKSRNGTQLLHPEAYYTLNDIPAAE